jgi:hypothetical protein
MKSRLEGDRETVAFSRHLERLAMAYTAPGCPPEPALAEAGAGIQCLD